MEAAMVSALMPLFEKILDKIFGLFDNASSTYNSSAKTDEDVDKFVKEAKDLMPEFEDLAKQIDPNFKMSGDADSSADFRTIVKVLEQLKTQTSDATTLKSLDSQIEAFTDAANKMDASGYKGDKGDADLKIELHLNKGLLSPTPGSSSVVVA
jgi:uncharacterized coiled-coil DUF342 family protein